MPDRPPPRPETDPRADTAAPTPRPLHFIEQIVEADNAQRTWGAWTDADLRGAGGAASPAPEAAARLGAPRVHTRFPPEPNGYLHVGHAKSIYLNFGLAARYGGLFNLRFDDTNPTKEESEYIRAIKRDVLWLGGDWAGPFGGGLYHASDYFERMVEFAEELIRKGKAYVCELSAEEVSSRRGKPGVPATSPFRDRPIDESLRLFREMRDHTMRDRHPDGSKTLRARIDLASPNFNLRDPVMYRILHEPHPHAGERWCIYPMYDWAHGLEDSLEGITHSVCTLEFEDHRPLYDWFMDAINEGRTGDGSGPWGRRVHHSRQIEFAKLIPSYTVLSKRNLLKMVQDKTVSGWDDPRMPTISGLRRRGYTPESIRAFVDEVGVTKMASLIDLSRLENSIRHELNRTAPRAMAVLRPLKVVIENWPINADGSPRVDELEYTINPEDPAAGKRKVQFSGVVYIERDDFMEVPPKKFFRLAPGQEVRLRWAYVIRCMGVIKNDAGEIVELRATADLATRGGDIPPGPDGKPNRKVQGTIHWASAAHAVQAEVRLFDRLFNAEEPGKRTGNWIDDLNPASLEVVRAWIDPWLLTRAKYQAVAFREPQAAASPRAAAASPMVGRASSPPSSPPTPAPAAAPPPTPPDAISWGVPDRFQFERLGYFGVDPDSAPAFGGSGPADAGLILNRIVTLKDSWAKQTSGA